MGSSREKQLIKNTGILALGKICTQFVSFFLLPLYTAYLSTKEYGVVDLLNNYVSLLIPIFFFQMDQALFRYLIDARKNDKKKSEIITTALITVSIQAIIFIVLYSIISIFIHNEYKYFLLTNVLGLMLNKVVIPIIYNDKTRELIQDIKFKGKYIDIESIDSFDVNELSDKDLSYKLNIDKYKEDANKHFEVLDKVLGRD